MLGEVRNGWYLSQNGDAINMAHVSEMRHDHNQIHDIHHLVFCYRIRPEMWPKNIDFRSAKDVKNEIIEILSSEELTKGIR